MTTLARAHIRWLRNTAPYINAHRGKTFVLLLGGGIAEHENFSHLIHDIALLNSLGVRLVLIHGSRSLIDQRLQSAGLEALYVTSSTGDHDLLLAAKAIRSPGGSIKVDNSILDSPESDISGDIGKSVIDSLSARQQRPLQEEEYEELREAVRTLSEDGIISPDDALFASAVVESRKVSIYI